MGSSVTQLLAISTPGAPRVDAIACYGVALGDELVQPWRELPGYEQHDAPWEWWYALKHALPPPPVAREHRPTDWRRYELRRRDLISACPVTILECRTPRYPLYVAALRSSIRRAHSGALAPLGVLRVDSKAIDPEIRKFCGLMGLPVRNPEWLLCSVVHR